MINLLKKPYKKKASKFQPFKKFFGRRKKREATPDQEDTKLKPSSSFGNVCNGLSSDEETNSGLRSSNHSMGTRAFSHESIFIPDGRTESEESLQAMSQENILGKVKTLQQQLAKNIKFGQPSQVTVSVKTVGEANASLEADVLLSSPMETEAQQDIVLPESNNKSGGTPDSLSPASLRGTRQEVEDKVTPVKSSSRPKRHHSPSGTIETVNLDAIPLAIARLDNSAAKHKLSVKPKNQRVSKKHRLSQEMQSVAVAEVEQEILEPQLYEDKISKHDGYHVADKPIQHRERQEQKEGKRKLEHCWRNLETEKKVEMGEAEVKSHTEHKRLQECQREKEGKKQKLQEEEQLLKMEERKAQEGKKSLEKRRHQEFQMQRHKGLEEQRRNEEGLHEPEEQMQQEKGKQHELKEQKQRQLEEQRHQELEAQRQLEEQRHQELEAQRQLEEQRHQELEAQRQLEEQRHQELEAQRQLEEQRHQELEAQRQLEEQRHQELVAQRQLEEQRHQELKAQRQLEEQRQQELKAQRQLEEQRHQELKAQRQLEEQRQQELKAQRQLEEQRQQELKAQRQLEEQRHQELEAQRQQEEQRHQELEAQRQLEEQRHRELEAQRQLEEQRHRELEMQRQLEEQKCQELVIERQRQEEEQRHRELEEQKWQELKDQEEVEEKRHRELEAKQQHKKLFQQGWKDRQEQGKQKWQEEKQGHQNLGQRAQGLEEQMNEAEKQDELKQEVLQVQKSQTDLRQKDLEKKRNLEGEERLQGKLEKQKRPEELPQNLKEKMNKDKQDQQELDKPIRSAAEHKRCEPQPWPEKRMQQEELIEREGGRKLEEQKSPSLEGQRPLEKPKEQDKSFPLQLDKNIHLEEQHLESPEKDLPLTETSQQMIKQPDKEQKEEETLRHHQKRNIEAQEQERILGEELRWQEVDARQSMPRGFTFQVSSGEKQIIFPKVNLSPVTPVKEAPTPSAAKELMTPKSSKGSHGPPTSLCVPHTAILVTGAQLCGTAVNLNQIKDTACKSLLGLTEERKTMDARRTSPDAKRRNSKMKYAQEPLGNQAIPAEWASIRSKILKSAENGKHNERDKGSLSRHSDDWTPKGQSTSHGNLRKTLSASAKFSITPAWQKFSEISKANASAESKVGLEAEKPAKQLGPPTVHSTQETVHTEALSAAGNNLGTPAGNTEIHHEVAGNTEGCKFAKDLPSFLVPGVSHSVSKEVAQSESAAAATETQQKVGTRKLDSASPNGEENVSPFGVKLRRTNYSLRFHYDQQAEQKKKKRYSAGDSFDGVPTPLVTPDNEKGANDMFLKENKSPSQDRKDVMVNSVKNSSANINQNYTTAAPVSLAASSHVSAPSQEKPTCKSPLLQKPALAPKPTSQTPPSSPLSKMRRSHLTESTGQRVGKTEPDTTWRKTEAKGSSLLSQAHEASKGEEEESREKRSFFPSITMPWRERTEKKPEALKKERPVLQSRHSIDGSKLIEKVETAQPLWITLALQKQKGFREQQATREERRQAREAKQAEKLAKENASISSHADTKSSSSRTSTLPRPAAQEEEKKAETPLSRFERREQLKKSNTLPTSVTVEISDSLPPSPLTKEVTKRFSTPEANPVSTEPAWLALAKRKAKAWSDCPQIIK
ncbi:cancer-related regulator of actin dynamics isoform X2 [Lacerta agilis]|uniref:cancer-related regulator of actin dynamics isoform X2 n=1 Tax=Lacerta agilis TaxID=80427 RepID=UPI00141A1E4F|nr:cancer-related regulator of actin dynamics isoform X2 [Lacerta agilis]